MNKARVFLNNKKTLISIIFIQLVLIISGAVWLFVSLKSDTKSNQNFERTKIPVEAALLKTKDFTTSIKANTSLEANDRVMLKPSDAGFIKEILFKSGSYVKKGDILIRLEDAETQARVADAKAKVELAKLEYQRAEGLVKRSVGTKQEMDKKHAELLGAQAALSIMEAKQDQTLLKAPFDGIVSFKSVSVGSYVKPGEDLVEIVDINPVILDFRIPEVYIEKVHVGQTIEVSVQGYPEYLFTAEIEAIDPVVDAEGHSFRVRATLPNTRHDLKPGLYAEMKIPIEVHKDVIIVPESAIDSVGNEEFVYVIADEKAHHVPVETGGRDGNEVEIKGGLRPGLMIVTSGQMNLHHGAPITVIQPKKLKAY